MEVKSLVWELWPSNFSSPTQSFRAGCKLDMNTQRIHSGMPKRRRERDRPKAAADAPYNPNKRILLSYESDDEKDAEQQSIGSQSATAPDAATADYKIEEYPDEDEESSTHAQSDEPPGVREDDAEAVQDGLGDGDQAGAPKHDKPTFSRASHKNDATGQWPALGSLSYQWEDEEEEEKKEDDEYDSTEEEAMAYLRSVRCAPSSGLARDRHTGLLNG